VENQACTDKLTILLQQPKARRLSVEVDSAKRWLSERIGRERAILADPPGCWRAGYFSSSKWSRWVWGRGGR